VANSANVVPYQWKPGQSGNPSGKPKSKPLSDLLRQAGENGAYKRIVDALVARALEGDIKAITVVLDRIEGRVNDKLIVEASGVDLMDILARKAQANAELRRTDDTTDSVDS
jgi:hypothetical protein